MAEPGEFLASFLGLDVVPATKQRVRWDPKVCNSYPRVILQN